jgi:anti-sigma regulatory factor (Ser/Thr protein kinase)
MTFRHQALPYGSNAELAAGVLPFVTDGLTAGDAVIVVTTPANAALLRDALGELRDEVDFVDSQDVYDAPARTLATFYERVADHPGPGRARVVGEPLWAGLTPFETLEWTRYESLVNVVFAATTGWLLCPHDTRELPASVLQAAARTHPEVLAADRPADYVEPRDFYAECNGTALPPAPSHADQLRFGGGELRSTRRFARWAAERAGVRGERAAGFVIAVNEVATNVLRYGGGHGSIAAWTEPGRLLCDVIDSGPGVDDHFLGHVPPVPDRERGAGLWVARQLCDLIEIRSGRDGTLVRLHLRVHGRAFGTAPGGP